MLPFANAKMARLRVAEISANVAPGAHALLTVDGASWHRAGNKLHVPDNIVFDAYDKAGRFNLPAA